MLERKLSPAMLVIATILAAFPSLASGQNPPGGAAAPDQGLKPPTPPPILTLFTIPTDANVRLKGATDLAGRTPLDLPESATGRYQIIVEGASYARTHGVIYLPPRGGLPFVVSEPREGSLALFLRGFNYPGVPAFTSGHRPRGITLALMATTGLVMAERAQIAYRDRLDEVGDFAADRAADEHSNRNAWLIYTGATLGLSAMDYWIRPRIDLSETTPTRLTLDVPETNRLGALWRSVLVPGAGQEFGNHRTRAVVWLAGTLVAGAGYAVYLNQVNKDETDVKWATLNVDSAGPSELPVRLLELEQQKRDLEASRNGRDAFGVALATVYGLNLLDAAIMYLRLPAPTRPRVASIEPVVSPAWTGASVRLRF